ncbi:unnamed protein product, partial [Bubo scandiacus]
GSFASIFHPLDLKGRSPGLFCISRDDQVHPERKSPFRRRKSASSWSSMYFFKHRYLREKASPEGCGGGAGRAERRGSSAAGRPLRSAR